MHTYYILYLFKYLPLWPLGEWYSEVTVSPKSKCVPTGGATSHLEPSVIESFVVFPCFLPSHFFLSACITLITCCLPISHVSGALRFVVFLPRGNWGLSGFGLKSGSRDNCGRTSWSKRSNSSVRSGVVGSRVQKHQNIWLKYVEISKSMSCSCHVARHETTRPLLSCHESVEIFCRKNWQVIAIRMPASKTSKH